MADTLLRKQKELDTEKETYISSIHIEQEFNMNENMNKLLVKLLIQCKLLNTKENSNIFDCNNQFIPTDKYDSKRCYKKADGYFQEIASINNHPVYIENRNGNSN
ncbi:MAG: hypothetical protein GQ564_14635 [Bacteroidales bacterium]|nr:hypothetical protein [Bacteroidales bacterium]